MDSIIGWNSTTKYWESCGDTEAIQKERKKETCVFHATSHPFLSQYEAFYLKSFSKKVYHEVYECFVKQGAGNYSVECDKDGAVLVRIHGAIPKLVRHIEPG